MRDEYLISEETKMFLKEILTHNCKTDTAGRLGAYQKAMSDLDNLKKIESNTEEKA